MLNIIKKEEIEKRVNKALNKLYSDDFYIIRIAANEETIAHKLACYLSNEFPELDVDFEYNRREHNVKKLNWQNQNDSNSSSEEQNVLPDIIVHKRGENNNLLVIEIKKSTNTDNGEDDKNKLKAFINDKKYKYKYGLFIRIDVGSNYNREKTILEWITNEKA